MDPTRHQCRLCLETSEDLVNIFDDFQGSPIASVLTQHFWFQVHKNDGLSECLCHTCWTNTRTFHNFYTKIKLVQKDYWNSVEKESVDPDIANLIEEEQIDNQRETTLQTDLTLVKYEEPPLEVIDVHASNDGKEESSDNDDDNSGGRSESVHSSEHDYQHPIKKRNKKTKEKQSLEPSKRSTTKLSTPCDNSEIEAKIREYFTMKCDLCTDDVYFESFRGVKKHYRTVHKEKGYITCCGKKFFRRCKASDHIQHHLNPDAHPCGQCGRRFENQRALKNHIANHEPLESRAHKCSLCSSSFTKATTLKYHVQNTHATKKDETFPCEKCNKTFQSKFSLAGHVRYIHELETTYICDTCGFAFKTKTILLKHMHVHSTTPRPKVQCNICGAWFKHLRQHLVRHKDIKSVNCPICNKIVKNKLSLQRHIRQVHSERRHQCRFCDKAFKTIKMLKEHVAIHTGEYLYSCPYCEKTFKSNANMYAHRKKAHLTEWTRDHAKKVLLEET